MEAKHAGELRVRQYAPEAAAGVEAVPQWFRRMVPENGELVFFSRRERPEGV